MPNRCHPPKRLSCFVDDGLTADLRSWVFAIRFAIHLFYRLGLACDRSQDYCLQDYRGHSKIPISEKDKNLQQ